MRFKQRPIRLLLLFLSLPLFLMVVGTLFQHVILVKKILMGDAVVFAGCRRANVIVNGKVECARVFRVPDTHENNIYKQKYKKMGSPYFMVYLGHGSFLGGAEVFWCSDLKLFRTWCARPDGGALYFGRWLVLSSTSMNCTYDVCDEFKGIGCDAVKVEKIGNKLVYKCLKKQSDDVPSKVILSLEIPCIDDNGGSAAPMLMCMGQGNQDLFNGLGEEISADSLRRIVSCSDYLISGICDGEAFAGFCREGHASSFRQGCGW